MGKSKNKREKITSKTDQTAYPPPTTTPISHYNMKAAPKARAMSRAAMLERSAAGAWPEMTGLEDEVTAPPPAPPLPLSFPLPPLPPP